MYDVAGVSIVKKIGMVYGENKIVIKYNVVNTLDEDIKIKLVPFVNNRNYHVVQNAKEYVQNYEDNMLEIDLGDKENKLFIKVTDANYNEYKNTFYKNMYYRIENARGFDDTESHYMPGEFSVSIEANSQKEIILVAEVATQCTIEEKFMPSLIRAEEIRLEKICKIASAKTDIEKELVMAADNFIISKNHEKTIIAGYPWFNDWGRDTFIALEGLTLKTNRFADAKSILKYFANYIKDGLVPNYIQDGGGQAYNTVDASLWYIEALNKYIEYTNDLDTLKELYPKVLEIVNAYKKGTLFAIKMQLDGLIAAGSKETQLTWMDAKIGDYIPTPRYGKAVEVNALWYNALKVTENLYVKLEKKFGQDLYDEIKKILNENLHIGIEELSDVLNGDLAKKVKESFKKFYHDEGLLDTIEPFNGQIRPNQIIALSLSYPVLSGEKAIEVMEIVKDKLLTDKGLKTLDSGDEEYKGKYVGDALARDSAYHQGTIWTWLLGEYAKAYENVYKRKYVYNNIQDLLTDGCIGNIAEIYDADEPREANGALAQAWGVSAMMYLK